VPSTIRKSCQVNQVLGSGKRGTGDGGKRL
jgi:hypothetical protein